MHTYICIYIYICIHTMHIYIFVHFHVYTYIEKYMHIQIQGKWRVVCLLHCFVECYSQHAPTCVLAYKCIYAYVHVHTYIYVYEHTYIHTYSYICIYIYSYLFIYMHIYIFIFMYMNVKIFIYAYTCVYLYMYIYIYMNIQRCIYVYVYPNIYSYIQIHTYFHTAKLCQGSIRNLEIMSQTSFSRSTRLQGIFDVYKLFFSREPHEHMYGSSTTQQSYRNRLKIPKIQGGVYICIQMHTHKFMCIHTYACKYTYGVASTSRLHKIIGFFCKRAL